MQKRNTLQKQIVKSAVFSLHNHATADEIYAYISKEYPSISRATVYRNLQSLTEDKEIAKREIANSPDRYDHITSNHYHIRCALCNKVIDANMEYLDKLENQISNKEGFEIISHNIVFDGICPDCKRKLNPKK